MQAKLVQSLQECLSYHFKDETLLEQALTHPSHKSARKSRCDFERLEFLGDAVLGMLVARMVFELFPNEREGDLAKRKAALVSRDRLVHIAEKWQLGRCIRYSERGGSSDSKKQASVLENACEAVIGAMFIDGGVEPVTVLVETFWRPMAEEAKAPPKDAKTALQEWAQAKGLPLPVYKEISRVGADHAPLFVIEVGVPGHPPARGEGRTKKVASTEAALRMLSGLENHGN